MIAKMTHPTDNPADTTGHRPADLWGRTKAVVGEALELAGDRRNAFVEAACAGDATLLSEVRALLLASEVSPETLGEGGPPAGALADALHTPAVATGAMIGRYRIERALGAGGMGTVFEATDTTLNRPVALKVLSVGLASTGARRRFESEATTLARLDHPAIARVYEAGVHHAADGAVSVPFFAMAYVDRARTLDQYVQSVGPSLNDVLDVFARVCDAVHHGHQKGVLHRDLKPSNILIDLSGQPRVIDFGVSRLLDAGAGTLATHAGDIVGTPAYLPPEAFEHGVQSLDTRGDVYSLGVVLYEVLAGANPFGTPDLTPLQIGARVRGKAPPLLGSLRPDCRGDVETIVAKAMAREPQDRYQSAEQFAADLRRVLSFEPILARPTPLLRQGVLFARRNRLLVAAAVAIVLAVGVGIGGLLAGLARARASERRAIQEATRARQVSTFITQMLRSASPFQGEQFRTRLSMDADTQAAPAWPSAATPGRAPTLGDLIAAAMEHLEDSFPDDPALQADVAATLAQTANTLSDSRDPLFCTRAAALLERAYGRDDVRALVARQYMYHAALVNSNTRMLKDMERDLATIRRIPASADDRLLKNSWALVYRAYDLEDRAREMLPTLRAIREEMDSQSAADSAHKLTLDLYILKSEVTGTDPVAAVQTLRDMLHRAHALDGGTGPQTLGVLFEIQMAQLESGDFGGALATLEQGVVIATRFYGGMDQATYEWWSNIYFVALLMKDFARAEHAAREQVRGSQAMLGPHSLYTTKAYGRLARTLLTQGKNQEEAQRAAQASVEGAPELLASGDGWALYHEVLWAWAIRVGGDVDRAEAMIRHRMDVEAKAGRPEAVNWVEIARATELAQCAMDRAQRDGTLAARAGEIEAHLQVAERHARDLGQLWPWVHLSEVARERWETIRPR